MMAKNVSMMAKLDVVPAFWRNPNGVSKYLYPQVPVPTYIYIDCNVNFKVLKNREDSSDFDDF